MDSTSLDAKCFYWEGGSAILYPTPVGIPLGIAASAILSTGDYCTGDYRHRSRIRCTTPTCRSGSGTIWINSGKIAEFDKGVELVKKLLIVDDAAFMRLSIRNMLLNYEIEIVGEAENGEIGVSMYKELRPDVVTMDITMPEMTGIEALKAIKAFDPQAKVIMVSAMGQEGMVKESIISGAKTFIVKPFKEDFLYQTISKVLGI